MHTPAQREHGACQERNWNKISGSFDRHWNVGEVHGWRNAPWGVGCAILAKRNKEANMTIDMCRHQLVANLNCKKKKVYILLNAWNLAAQKEKHKNHCTNRGNYFQCLMSCKHHRHAFVWIRVFFSRQPDRRVANGFISIGGWSCYLTRTVVVF